jgi:hypothetical protein
MFPGQGGDQMVGNQIAQLTQQRELAARWLASCSLLHDLPCGRSNIRKPTSLFRPINPVGRLWFFFKLEGDKIASLEIIS